MKYLYILASAIILPIAVANAQDNSNNQSSENSSDTIYASLKTNEEINNEEVNYAIFSSYEKKPNYGGCSLIKKDYREREIYTYKNGYKIVTKDKDEVVRVKRQKDGSRKIKYSNEFESLKYHKDANGKLHYNYSFDNFECKKIKIRRNKKGVTSVTNKSGMELEEAKNNVKSGIDQGSSSCFLVR